MTDVPAFQHTMNPLLDVLRESPSPLGIETIEERVAARMRLPPELLAVPHDPTKPDRSEVGYRIAWARTWLKKAGLIQNPRRGAWTVTDEGRAAGHVDVDRLLADVRAMYEKAGADAPPVDEDEGGDAGLVGEATSPEASLEAQTAIDASEDEASSPRVAPILARELADLHDKLGEDGAFPTRREIARMVALFRERFGPEVLAGLDGLPLLQRLHARGTRDSLVHWLEFKEDDELTTSTFGSIAGGSALKFGLYQSAETEAWMTGTPQKQQRLERDDAVARAREQRDELVAAARVLAGAGRSDVIDHEALQQAILAAAPTIGDTSWCHKVLAMWFPDLLDPFHAPAYQRHHLLRLLKLPLDGRYANAAMFSGIARKLGMTLLELAKVLVRRNGAPYAAWRIGTRITDASAWDAMRAGGYAAIGWPRLGDLSAIEASKQGKEAIRSRLEATYPNAPSALSKIANQIYAFVRTAEERDLVVAMDGAKVLGVGRLAGPYEFLPDDPAGHRRRVTWELAGEPWPLPQSEGLLTTFVQLQKHPLNLVEIEARLLGRSLAPAPGARVASVPPVVPVDAPSVPPEASLDASVPASPPPPLHGVAARIESVLHRKRQVILYGPPGTGKTHWASVAGREIVARGWLGRAWSALDEAQRRDLEARRSIELVSFHPAYGYEDFLEGYRPAGGGAFELRDGVFKRLCARAAADAGRPYLLIIDEINRGDLPRIFGELLTVIERDKRGRTITLPLSGAPFAVPDNVLVIGTMNTADRSIALLDAALRRRFGFVELLPEPELFAGILVDRIPLRAWLEALNEKILEHAGRDARNLRVGHAYFLQGGAPVRERARFAEILRDDVIPLLEEVCYEDFDALERILGGAIVQRAKKRIAGELFDPERWSDLQDAILQALPKLATTKAAAEAEAATQEAADDEPESATGAEGA